MHLIIIYYKIKISMGFSEETNLCVSLFGYFGDRYGIGYNRTGFKISFSEGPAACHPSVASG